MNTEPENSAQPTSAQARIVVRPPLGLPVGSVRALLTLPIVAVVIVQVARNRDLEPLWIETLMIALAHYFTSRRFINLPGDVIRRLEAEGHVESEGNPLFLPRYSIRAAIVLLVLLTTAGAYLWDRPDLVPNQLRNLTLGLVLFYFGSR